MIVRRLSMVTPVTVATPIRVSHRAGITDAMWLGLVVVGLAAVVGFGMALRRAERGKSFVGPPRLQDVVGLLVFVAAVATVVYTIDNTNRVNDSLHKLVAWIRS